MFSEFFRLVPCFPFFCEIFQRFQKRRSFDPMCKYANADLETIHFLRFQYFAVDDCDEENVSQWLVFL